MREGGERSRETAREVRTIEQLELPRSSRKTGEIDWNLLYLTPAPPYPPSLFFVIFSSSLLLLSFSLSLLSLFFGVHGLSPRSACCYQCELSVSFPLSLSQVKPLPLCPYFSDLSLPSFLLLSSPSPSWFFLLCLASPSASLVVIFR